MKTWSFILFVPFPLAHLFCTDILGFIYGKLVQNPVILWLLLHQLVWPADWTAESVDTWNATGMHISPQCKQQQEPPLQYVISVIFGSGTDPISGWAIVLVVAVGATFYKQSWKLHRFKSDQNEIWQVNTLHGINLIWHHTSRRRPWRHIHAEKCCHQVSVHAASSWNPCSSIRQLPTSTSTIQFLSHSTFVLFHICIFMYATKWPRESMTYMYRTAWRRFSVS